MSSCVKKNLQHSFILHISAIFLYSIHKPHISFIILFKIKKSRKMCRWEKYQSLYLKALTTMWWRWWRKRNRTNEFVCYKLITWTFNWFILSILSITYENFVSLSVERRKYKSDVEEEGEKIEALFWMNVSNEIHEDNKRLLTFLFTFYTLYIVCGFKSPLYTQCCVFYERCRL